MLGCNGGLEVPERCFNVSYWLRYLPHNWNVYGSDPVAEPLFRVISAQHCPFNKGIKNAAPEKSTVEQLVDKLCSTEHVSSEDIHEYVVFS